MSRGVFDFNRDGRMSSFERAAEFTFLHQVTDHQSAEKDAGAVDDEIVRSIALVVAGLDEDELRLMDEYERREVIEDAGLDPDNYDYLDF